MLRGKPRSFGVGLLLTIVTCGIYPWFWHYMAFKELHDQENRTDFPLGLFICSFIPFLNLVCMPLFMSHNLDFLNSLRAKRGLPPIFGIGGFLAWYVLGSWIIVGPFIAYSRLQNAINELWTGYPPVPATVPVLP